MYRLCLLPLAALLALTPAPAHASQERPTPIPEPTDAALFAMGLAGLIVGRRFARKPPKD